MEEIHQKEDDAYAEDDLPDLVLGASASASAYRKDSTSSNANQDSNSSSVIDLLLSMSKVRGRSVSSSDICQWADAGDDEIDHFDGEEVSVLKILSENYLRFSAQEFDLESRNLLYSKFRRKLWLSAHATFVSFETFIWYFYFQVKAERTLNDDFKVTYTNHSKNYVPKVSSTEVYRSYLSLMPDDDDEETVMSKSQEAAKIHEERLKILAHFQALTGQEQTEQRELWSEELAILEKEMAELKIQLGAQINRRNHLRLMLGLDMIKKVAKKSMDHLAKEMRDLISNAKGNANEDLPTSIENNNAKLQ